VAESKEASVKVEFLDCTPPKKMTTVFNGKKIQREVWTHIRAVSSEGDVLLQVGADHYLTDVEKAQWTARILAEVKKVAGGSVRSDN
jgi:hypothetical protein